MRAGGAGATLFGLAAVIGALAWSQPDVDGADLWWHLAAGRAHAESGEVVRTDPFSHTALGRPWINHAWLWDRLAWAAYRQHEDLLAWLELALIGATFALVAVRARRTSGSWLATCASTWLAAATCHWFLDIRPHIVTLFFTALLLATLEWRRAPWLWPAVMALWANLHGGFLFGLGLLGFHALAETERAFSQRTSRAASLRVWAGVAAAAAAACIHPWGISIYGVPFQPLDPGTPYQYLIEWHGTSLSLDPTTYAGRFGWMLVLAAASGFLARHRDPFSLALAAITAAMALSARRFIPLFAIVAAPIVAQGIAAAGGAARQRLPAIRSSPRLHALAGGAALFGALALWHDARLTPHLLQRWTFGRSFPSGAVAHLEAMPAPPQHLFNSYDLGGHLMLEAPSVPVFIDGRAGTVYPDQVARDYLVLAAAAPGWQQLLDAYQIDAVLVESGAPLAMALLSAEPPWRVAHSDPRSTLLFPPGVPIVDELGLEGADLHLLRGAAAREQGRLREATSELEIAQRLDPLLLATYGELMLASARGGDAAGVRRWLDTALEEDPGRSDQIWLYAAEAWKAMGDAAAQIDALQRVELGGPFGEETWQASIRAMIRAAERRQGAG